MPIIQIAGTVIQFPESGTSPNWSTAVDDFAVAVADALSGVVGPADVSPQTLSLDSYNGISNVNLPNLTFSTAIVRGAIITYALYRSTDSASSYRTGQIMLVYNPNGTSSNKWEHGQQFVGTNQETFNVTDIGQVQISLNSLAGINHAGRITYSGKAILQTV